MQTKIMIETPSPVSLQSGPLHAERQVLAPQQATALIVIPGTQDDG